MRDLTIDYYFSKFAYTFPDTILSLAKILTFIRRH